MSVEIDVELLIHAVEQLWGLSDPAYVNMRYAMFLHQIMPTLCRKKRNIGML